MRSELTDGAPVYSNEIVKPRSVLQLPFCDGDFSLEYWQRNWLYRGLVMKYKDERIGFRAFQGVKEVGTLYESNFPSFIGFESHMDEFFSSRIGMQEQIRDALFVKEEFRERFYGIGKTLVTESLKIMLDELPEYLKAQGRDFDSNMPFFMSKMSRSPIWKYYDGQIVTDYSNPKKINDIVVYGNVVLPRVDIGYKN